MWANEIDYNSIRPAAGRHGASRPEPGTVPFFSARRVPIHVNVLQLLTYIP